MDCGPANYLVLVKDCLGDVLLEVFIADDVILGLLPGQQVVPGSRCLGIPACFTSC